MLHHIPSLVLKSGKEPNNLQKFCKENIKRFISINCVVLHPHVLVCHQHDEGKGKVRGKVHPPYELQISKLCVALYLL